MTTGTTRPKIGRTRDPVWHVTFELTLLRTSKGYSGSNGIRHKEAKCQYEERPPPKER